MKIYRSIKFDTFFVSLILIIFFLSGEYISKNIDIINLDKEIIGTPKPIFYTSETPNKHNYNLKFKQLNYIQYKLENNPKIINHSIKAVIIPAGNLYLTNKLIKKTLDKIDWNNYDSIIYLSVSHNTKDNWILPKNIFNKYLDYDNIDKIGLFKEKGKIRLGIEDLFNEFENEKLTKDINIDKTLEIFNKENEWQNILPYLLSLNKKINLLTIIVGSYNENLKNILLKYLKNNNKTLLIVNLDSMHCGLLYSKMYPMVNSSEDYDRSTMENIKADINGNFSLDNKFKDSDSIYGYKNIYLFSQICRDLNYRTYEVFYNYDNKEIGIKSSKGYISMLVTKN